MDIPGNKIKYFYKERIYIVRDLCIRSENEIRDIIDADIFNGLSEKLEKYGLCFRAREDDAMMYGYPSYVKKISEKKGDYWEYRFFTELMLLNYDWLTPLRNDICIARQKDYYKTSTFEHSSKKIKDFMKHIYI